MSAGNYLMIAFFIYAMVSIQIQGVGIGMLNVLSVAMLCALSIKTGLE